MNLRWGVALTVVLSVLAGGCARESTAEDAGNVVDVLVDGENCRGAHVSTRPHNRKVVYHGRSGTWFVFYGTGHWLEAGKEEEMAPREMIAWRCSSDDGKTWSGMHRAVVGNGHSSSTDVLLSGDTIYMTGTRWGYWRQKANILWKQDGKVYYHRGSRDRPMFYAPHEVFGFKIEGGKLTGGKASAALPGDKHVMHAAPHYGSMTRDTKGHLWVAARALSKPPGLDVWVARSERAGDASAWTEHEVLFHSTGPGTVAAQIIALGEGHVGCVIFAKHEQMTAVTFYDPGTGRWSEPEKIGTGSKRSKRTCGVYDAHTKRLHVVYTDERGDLRHRSCRAPYRTVDWSPPLAEAGTLVAVGAGTSAGDDDLTLSVDRSRKPAALALVHRGRDQRLHLRYYDGKAWLRKDVSIGLADERFGCDEASAVEDFSHGLGFIYWCQWLDDAEKRRHNAVGQMRFCLVKDVKALFSE